MKIWFRVGMEADITEEELKTMQNMSHDYRAAEHVMQNIIERGVLSGETYILGKSNGGCDEYDNPEKEINFLF